MKLIRVLLIVPCLFMGTAHAAVNSDSMTAAQRWVAAKFFGDSQAARPGKSFLEPQLKPNALVRDRIEGHPLLIVQQKFDNGIVMRSPGQVVVHLSSGASSFQAVVGTDSNDLGYYANTGRGSVVASIEAGGKQLFESPVLHEGMKGIPVRVELGGAREITLRLKAVGERPPTYQAEWDQADWGKLP